MLQGVVEEGEKEPKLGLVTPENSQKAEGDASEEPGTPAETPDTPKGEENQLVEGENQLVENTEVN